MQPEPFADTLSDRHLNATTATLSAGREQVMLLEPFTGLEPVTC